MVGLSCHKQISVLLIRFLEFQRCGNFDPSRDFGDRSCVPANGEALDGGISAFLLGYVSQSHSGGCLGGAPSAF